jgi:hypothetical protein
MLQMYVSSVSEVCCNSYIWTLQKYQDVVRVAYFASVVKGMLQVFVKNVSSILNVCCNKCFIWMLHMFHTYVASVFT